MTNNELKRANKVTVVTECELFKAVFYKTHKIVKVVSQEITGWTPTIENQTKTGNRESFRAYIIEHAKDFGVLWQPQDMRSESNVRMAKYNTDEQLLEDAVNMTIPQMRDLVEKCKYDIKWVGIEADEITPMTETGKGTDLSTLGIKYGKYKNSGNWAWANITLTVIFKYKKQEVYFPVTMQLVSGQLKKCKIGITAWNEAIKNEIITAGLATEKELDPPKEEKSKSKSKPKSKSKKSKEIEAE